jgi:hypothetical protein
VIKTAEELEAKLAPFEYPAPEPLSFVPSVALRQAVADVRHVVSRGALIDMDTYGQVNGACRVCFAGATLLARGVYQKGVQAIMSSIENRHDSATRRRDGNLRLATGSLWRIGDVPSIANAFNYAREGDFTSLLERGGVGRVDISCIQSEITRNFHISYDGKLSDDEVEDLCVKMLQVADFLETEGY